MTFSQWTLRRILLWGGCVLLVGIFSACQGSGSALTEQSIRLASSPQAAVYAEQLLIGYQQMYPRSIQGKLITLHEADLWEALQQGDIDAIIHLGSSAPEGSWTAPLGLTALVAAVNPANPVGKLTRDELKDIYQGRMNNWRELGGADGVITHYAFVGDSEMDRLFTELALGGGHPAPDALIAPGAWAMRAAALDDPAALVCMLCSDNAYGIKVLTIDGVNPDYQRMKDGSYPLSIPVLLTMENPVPDEVSKFAAWAQSPAGESIFQTLCMAGDG